MRKFPRAGKGYRGLPSPARHPKAGATLVPMAPASRCFNLSLYPYIWGAFPGPPFFLMEAGMAKKPTYSFSKLETDEKCPWAYKKIYLDRVPRAETEPLVIGKTLHDLTAQYLERLIGAQLQTDWSYAEGLTPKEAPADVFDIWPRFFNS